MPADLSGLVLNGQKTWLKKTLTTGDVLQCNILETEESANVTESDIPLPIIYEDDDLMVINKPAGMPIHPSMGHHEGTLANSLCWYTHHTLGFDKYVNRVINRLDRDTSGLLISAKNMLSAAKLSNMVRAREIHREYLAICHGDVAELAKGCSCVQKYFGKCIETSNASGAAIADTFDVFDKTITTESGDYDITIDAPIARKEASVIERTIDFERGERAVTHIKLLSYDPERKLSLVRLKLETGRTHQIRVHMRYTGHPLIGDFLYNPDYRFIKRQALHSRRLRFKHPITGEELDLTAPMPVDMKSLFLHYSDNTF